MHLAAKGVGQNGLHPVTHQSWPRSVCFDVWKLEKLHVKHHAVRKTKCTWHLAATPCPCFHWSGRTSHSPSLIIEVLHVTSEDVVIQIWKLKHFILSFYNLGQFFLGILYGFWILYDCAWKEARPAQFTAPLSQLEELKRNEMSTLPENIYKMTVLWIMVP